MMKKILLLLFILVSFFASGQVLQEPNVYGYKFKRVGADSLLFIPSDTLRIPTSYNGLSYVAKIGSTLYYWGGTKWLSFVSGSTYTFTNGITESGGTVEADTSLISTRAWRQKGDDSLAVYINAKADTINMINVDTTGAVTGDIAKINKATNTVYFEPQTGDSTWYISFKTGVTTYAPAVGDSLFKHTKLVDKVMDVYREGERQVYDDTSGYEYIIADTTIVFHPVLATNERIDITLRDSTRQRWLALEAPSAAVTSTIAYVSSYSPGLGSPATSRTFSFTTSSGTDRMLVVSITGDVSTGADDITGVTYNGTAMTFGTKKQPSQSGDRWLYMYYLKDPASGTHDVVISRTTSAFIIPTAAEYTGVNAVEDTVMNTCGCSALTTNFTTTANNCWAVVGMTSAGVAISSYTDITKRVSNSDYNTLFDSNGALTPAGSHSYSTTGVQSFQTHAALILKPY